MRLKRFIRFFCVGLTATALWMPTPLCAVNKPNDTNFTFNSTTDEHFGDPTKYSAKLERANILRIHTLAAVSYDEERDLRWASETSTLYYVLEEDAIAGKSASSAEHKIGNFYIYNENCWSVRSALLPQNARVTSTNNSLKVVDCYTDGSTRWKEEYMDIDWTIPSSLKNKSFYVYIRVNVRRGTSCLIEDVYEKCLARIDLTKETRPQLMIPSITADDGNGYANAGKMMLYYIAPQDTFSYKINIAEYYDQTAWHDTIGRAGPIYFYGQDTLQNVSMIMYLKLNDTLMKTYTVSEPLEVPAYHRIHDLNVECYRFDGRERKGAYEVTWKVKYPDVEDLMPSDIFEIQRATNWYFDDAVTIGSINYNSDPDPSELVNNELTYHFIDSSESVMKGDLNPVVCYRVRRASSMMWDWDDSNILNQLQKSKVAEWTYFDYNRSAGRIGNVVLEAGLDTLKDKHYVRKDADWESNRQVHIHASTHNESVNHWLPEMPSYGVYDTELMNLYWHSDQVNFILVKRIITETDTTDTEIIIPKDSITQITVPYYGQFTTWEIDYTDIADQPCVHYQYFLCVDTATSPINVEERKQAPYQIELPVYASGDDWTPDPQDAYFNDGMKIDPDPTVSFGSDTLPDFTLLRWGTVGGSFAHYTIRRSLHGADNWTTIAEKVTENYYLDRKAPIGKACDYRIIGILDCYNEVRDSLQIEGYRYEYGSVSGFVTQPNGMAYASVKVLADCEKTGVHRSTITDERGYYLLDSLRFEEGACYYDIAPEGTGFYPVGRSVVLDGESATLTNISFVNQAAIRFSGRVLYENSTIPVYHAQFKVNGELCLDSSGEPIETDANGNFTLMVPAGNPTIQVVMEGHKFMNDGYFEIEGSRQLPLNDNLDGVRMYDQTKVTLIGRLAGGWDEGEKVWGDVTAINNLGDNLTIIMELEGDNTSQMVYFAEDPTRTEIDTTYQHGVTNHYTRTEMTRKRITIHPDSITGEYRVDLFPVKYKVIQVTAEGYSTLFPSGTTSQSIDLSNSIVPIGKMPLSNDYYHNTYSVIYRAPIALTYEQVLYGLTQDFLGEEKIVCLGIGDESKIDLILRDSTKKAIGYLFDYPVFLSGKAYQLRVQAHEDYYYNNDPLSNLHTQVILKGGEMRLYNGLATDLTPTTAHFDDLTGYAYVTIPVNNPTFALQGEKALRQVDMSVKRDGLYIQCEPLRGYVSGTKSKGKDYIQELGSSIVPIDVIRDPQGAHSYSYVDQGTTYNVKFTSSWDLKAGVSIGIDAGAAFDQFAGVVAAPMGAGMVDGVITEWGTTLPLTVDLTGRWAGAEEREYSFKTTERIQTSADPLMIGAPADIYLGTEMVALLSEQNRITCLDSAAYRAMYSMVESGKMRVLGQSQDGNAYIVALDEFGFGKTFKGSFAYTQSHIVNTILPQLLSERNSLLRKGSDEEMQDLANQTLKAVFQTLVDEDDENFGTEGYYKIIYPYVGGVYTDKVAHYNQLIADWCEMIAANERVKLNCLTKTPDMTFDLSSGVTRTQSETAATNGGSNWFYYGLFTSAKAFASSLGGTAGAAVGKLLKTWYSERKNDNPKSVYAKIFGSTYSFHFDPIIEFPSQQMGLATEGDNKTAGFVLETASSGYETVQVYRLTDNDFNEMTEDDREASYTHTDEKDNNSRLSADYVFIRKGGASRCPYEDAETTMFYQPGKVLSEATLKMDKPTITSNRHEISNVPADETAVFVLTLSNESEISDDRTLLPTAFTLFMDNNTNSNGLTILMDGQPLTDGRTILLTPGESIQKTIELVRGTVYDYEDITLILRSECDIKNEAKVLLTVHYMPVSCPVTLQMPVNNWLLNTLSPFDKQGYYLPVAIGGFDVNYNEFDHIDFQYKLQTQSDEQWVTQCSFYADSALYKRASGNKAMIENGKIENVKFYGERDPIEQKYDLRAVAYCRLGSGFVTRSSELRSGTKDTRCPQVFGSMSPSDGILNVGDVIAIPFSELIADNYLDEDYNFQVIGYTNSSSVTTETSLLFDNNTSEPAISEVECRPAEQDFSLDVMVLPDNYSKEMVYLCMGTENSYISFGSTSDGKLALEVSTPQGVERITSRTLSPSINWRRVLVTYSHSDGSVHFYDGATDITANNSTLSIIPEIAGKILAGNRIDHSAPYIGRMLEMRIWTKRLTQKEIAATYEKRLTGYENGLLAYYPMSDAVGTVIHDQVNNTHLLMDGQTWAHPEGLSLYLAGDSISLDGNAFLPSDMGNYTYMMWFKHPAEETTIPLFTAANYQLLLSTEGLSFIQPEMEIVAQGNYMDNQWHHLAVSVNHSTNIGAMYIDGLKTNTFDATYAIAPTGMKMAIGPMNGYVDDISFWEMALPENYLSSFYTHMPNDLEMGLVFHLPFSERRLNSSGIYETVYCPYNTRQQTDKQGNIIPRKPTDHLVLSTDEKVSLLASSAVAPAKEKGDLKKMNFSWVGRDKDLVINLNMPDWEINKQNIFITVRGVEDLAGNTMQSPITQTVFVDRNQLRWSDKLIEKSIPLGTTSSFAVAITNQSGNDGNFTITGIPDWLSADITIGTIAATGEKNIHFTISDMLDPGQYMAIVYLTDANGLSEPLHLTITVEATAPEWNVDKTRFTQTMNIVAQIEIKELDANNNIIRHLDTDPRDIVAAFYDGRCVGTRSISSEKSLVYLTIYGNEEMTNAPIVFQLWRASTGRTYYLEGDTIIYMADQVIGTSANPVQLSTGIAVSQNIALSEGWNWVSFYIQPFTFFEKFSYTFAPTYPFAEHDLIKADHFISEFANGTWQGNKEPLDYHKRYQFFMHNAGTLSVSGTILLTPEERTITLRHGWNYLPYLMSETQLLSDAMADYLINAQPGDIIKSYTEFATFTQDRHWEGSLTHMRPGVGYLLYRNAEDSIKFTYYNLLSSPAPALKRNTLLKRSHNMSIIAMLDTDIADKGSALQAYMNDELVGEAYPDQNGRYYLMVSADENSTLRFRYNGQEAATSVEYKSQNRVGTAEQPLLISLIGKNGVSVGPSPFDDQITIDANCKEGDLIMVKLINTVGQTLFTYQEQAANSYFSYTIDGLSFLPADCYLAQVYVNNQLTTVKLIKF